MVRLVATGRLRDPVLHLLLRDPALDELPRHRLQAMAEELAEIEGATRGCLTAEAASAALFPTGRPHAHFVNAAFAYWEANRFNPAGRGAWYAGFELETAMAEVRFHITRALRDAGSYEAVVEWSEMWASMAASSWIRAVSSRVRHASILIPPAATRPAARWQRRPGRRAERHRLPEHPTCWGNVHRRTLAARRAIAAAGRGVAHDMVRQSGSGD